VDVPAPGADMVFWLTIDTLAAQLGADDDPELLGELVRDLVARHDGFFDAAWRVSHPATAARFLRRWVAFTPTARLRRRLASRPSRRGRGRGRRLTPAVARLVTGRVGWLLSVAGPFGWWWLVAQFPAPLSGALSRAGAFLLRVGFCGVGVRKRLFTSLAAHKYTQFFGPPPLRPLPGPRPPDRGWAGWGFTDLRG